MDTYSSSLEAVKQGYPFKRWSSFGLVGYTEEACAQYAAVFDRLVVDLGALGPSAAESEKLELFEHAVLALNGLNESDGLVETGEREDLCMLVNTVARAAGMDPDKYCDGEGPAGMWRDW